MQGANPGECVSSYILMSHVTHVNESCHLNESCHTSEWVMSSDWGMSHIRVSRLTHLNSQVKLMLSWKDGKTNALKWQRERDREREMKVTGNSVTVHLWKSRVARMNESGHTLENMKKTRKSVRLRLLCLLNEKCDTSECVMWHIWMCHHVAHVNESCHGCHGIHMNESCRTYEQVMVHIWMSHVAHINASRHTLEWVMWIAWHIRMSHGTHMKESCRTYERVTSHNWTSRVAGKRDVTWQLPLHESCHTYECVMSHI